MTNTLYTIKRESPTCFILRFCEDIIGESMSLANALVMQDQHIKHRDATPLFLIPQAS